MPLERDFANLRLVNGLADLFSQIGRKLLHASRKRSDEFPLRCRQAMNPDNRCRLIGRSLERTLIF